MPSEIPSHAAAPRRSRGKAVAAGTLTAVGVATGLLVGVGTSGAVSTGAGTTASPAPGVTYERGGSRIWPSGMNAPAESANSASTAATPDQQVGLVTIDTVLGYQNAEAAGTGMVLTSDGEILTNNHVVQGSTGISVTIVSTGATYRASVIGTDPTDDVAVLQLDHASGLQVADFSNTAADLGEAVTAVGNAGGTGSPSAVSGTITAVEQSITATDQNGADPENLHGLLETDADVVAGDSGGPLYDTASGEIVGMDTAASSGGDVNGYAIPIADALTIAGRITSGVDDATVHQGYPAFLGISVAPDATGGAGIAGVLSGGPAEAAGLTAGDAITAVDGTAIGSSTDLPTVLGSHDPGDTVSVTWTDSAGATHTAHVTLASGPAD